MTLPSVEVGSGGWEQDSLGDGLEPAVRAVETKIQPDSCSRALDPHHSALEWGSPEAAHILLLCLLFPSPWVFPNFLVASSWPGGHVTLAVWS